MNYVSLSFFEETDNKKISAAPQEWKPLPCVIGLNGFHLTAYLLLITIVIEQRGRIKSLSLCVLSALYRVLRRREMLIHTNLFHIYFVLSPSVTHRHALVCCPIQMNHIVIAALCIIIRRFLELHLGFPVMTKHH